MRPWPLQCRQPGGTERDHPVRVQHCARHDRAQHRARYDRTCCRTCAIGVIHG